MPRHFAVGAGFDPCLPLDASPRCLSPEPSLDALAARLIALPYRPPFGRRGPGVLGSPDKLVVTRARRALWFTTTGSGPSRGATWYNPPRLGL
jgi:hypothetical protein